MYRDGVQWPITLHRPKSSMEILRTADDGLFSTATRLYVSRFHRLHNNPIHELILPSQWNHLEAKEKRELALHDMQLKQLSLEAEAKKEEICREKMKWWVEAVRLGIYANMDEAKKAEPLEDFKKNDDGK